MIDNSISKLHAQIAAVCPIDGVSVGRKDDKATWRIDFRPEATEAQRTAAQAIKDRFDFGAAQAEQAVEREREAKVQAKMRVLAEAMVDDPAVEERLLGRAPRV